MANAIKPNILERSILLFDASGGFNAATADEEEETEKDPLKSGVYLPTYFVRKKNLMSCFSNEQLATRIRLLHSVYK